MNKRNQNLCDRFLKYVLKDWPNLPQYEEKEGTITATLEGFYESDDPEWLDLVIATCEIQKIKNPAFYE